jgi:hypothetical protein
VEAGILTQILGYDNIGKIASNYFRKITKGVISLGKTVIKHKLAADGVSTACGRDIGFGTTIKVNKTWRGVTCKKCLAVRAKAARTNTRRVGASV